MATDFRLKNDARTFTPNYDWDAGMGGEISSRTRKMIWGGIALALILPPAAFFALSPFPPVDTVKHQFARLGCPTATQLGLAPAEAGQAGYHASLDEDADGIACEVDKPRGGAFGQGNARP